MPSDPRLKTAAEFRLIGTSPPQVDLHDKVSGRTKYGIDVRTPGMRFATVVHPPTFGGSLKSFDATRARGVAGVRDVVQIPTGIAVVADNTWAAFQGAKALQVEWNRRVHDELRRHLRAAARGGEGEAGRRPLRR